MSAVPQLLRLTGPSQAGNFYFFLNLSLLKKLLEFWEVAKRRFF